MFRKILFATSASPACDNAAKVAFDLARVHDAELTVFHVLGIPSHGFSQGVRDYRSGYLEELSPDYVDWVIDELRHVYENQLEMYSKCTFEVAAGIPSREILRMARKIDVDCIILGAHTSNEDMAISKYRSIVGNTLRKVSKAAKCPVLIVNRPCMTCWNYFAHIVVGVDFSKHSDQAFQFALQTAKELKSTLHIFHALDLNYLHHGIVPNQETIEKALSAAKKKLEYHYLSQLNDFTDYTYDIREGVPFVEILKFAREKQADLIVMSHHARDVNLDEADMGSTVEQVVLRSACPVANVSHSSGKES
ncbi:MAG: universal stress protein [Desulfovermiculus sp.]|nr:universal stress protein [Desulfovermiculus sp.]